MEDIKLSLGDRIEIEVYDDKTGTRQIVLVSQYEKKLSDGSLLVAAPMHRGQIYPILRGTELGIVFEVNKELYRFSAEAAERKAIGNILLLRIIPKSKVVHLQRRAFFRFSVVLDVMYRFFENKSTPKEERGEFKKTISRDISGGGLCLLTIEEPTHGWFVEGKISEIDGIKFVGRIVRVTRIHEKGNYNYEIGVDFSDIAEIDREKVISFIFDSQRKLLKKGWSTK